MAQRLEIVRANAGAENLRDFWKRLMEEAPRGYSVSYEAVRNYHSGREAPVTYLARVAEAFGYRFEWLATGVGPRTEVEAQTVTRELGDVIWEGFVKGCGDFNPPRHIEPLVFSLWRQAQVATGQTEYDSNLPADIARLLLAPLRALGAFDEPRPSFSEEAFESYCVAMAPAVAAAFSVIQSRKG